MRSGLALLAILLISIPVVLAVRSSVADGGGPDASPAPAASSAGTTTPSESTPSSGSPSSEPTALPTSASPSSASPTAEPTTEKTTSEEIVRSGTVGDGTWTIAEPATESEPTAGTVHTYALRVENGTDIDADEAAQEVARILADPRGWQATEDVAFRQVADPEQADVTISIASPPTVDEMCLPAQTDGLWSCRIDEDVALNSDRWLHLTPTYEDTAEYRAYMVNHEMGHFLGHDHTSCPGQDVAAPVMLQQSIDLGGCRPNAWPAEEG